jgi:hypothetical protein
MTHADLVWNRATLEKGGSHPRAGDRALAALLRAHNLAMNGGILHAVELLDESELDAARSGYQYFGFDSVAGLLSRAKDIFDANVDLGSFERPLDSEYDRYIPSDSSLAQRFERLLHQNPDDFCPF